MQTVQLLIDVLGPVVLIVGLGAVLGSRLGFDVPTLSKIAYWIFGPAFVFDIFATTSMSADTAARLAAGGITAVVVGALVAVAIAPAFGVHGPAASASVMSAGYGNVGNTGLAICVFAFGEQARAEAGVLMVTIMFFGTFLSVWLGTRQNSSPFEAARRAILSPMIVAAIVGFFLNVAGIDLPLAAGRAVSLVAEGLIPTMLITLGVQLAATEAIRWLRSTSVVALAKLVAAPLAAAAVAAALGLRAEELGVVVLQSAMPPAVFCMVLAIEHDLEADRTTNDVVVTTVAALITLPVALALVT